eukprot:scaffold106_cov123-Cylindrotheca_fusiformis.AAC.8
MKLTADMRPRLASLPAVRRTSSDVSIIRFSDANRKRRIRGPAARQSHWSENCDGKNMSITISPSHSVASKTTDSGKYQSPYTTSCFHLHWTYQHDKLVSTSHTITR